MFALVMLDHESTMLDRYRLVPLPYVQFPVFDESFPRSFVYGTIGFTIGHEISHSLDVNGRKRDANGEKREWWKKKWTEEYDKRALCYKELYDIVKIPNLDVSLNGTLTLAENIADNEGIKIAYRAYKKYAAKLKDAAKSDIVDGFTQDQLFFLGFSQKYCRKTAEFTLYEQNLRDVHAPSEFRIDMVSKNFPPFANAFHCSPKLTFFLRSRNMLYEVESDYNYIGKEKTVSSWLPGRYTSASAGVSAKPEEVQSLPLDKEG
ncbi:hypothetical protein GCK32_001200 [Trichostrongylus colubriformis]|uniref:Peptidase M13 C-terminal domain-containing protein n=1 Tax=Trichostrongylus colubriformis TaxID=6319 RepID=A0AAN8G4L3_TRICO